MASVFAGNCDTQREFLDNFVKTLRRDDPLPVNVSSYRISEGEVDGAVVDWTLQYLEQKNCPIDLAGLLARKVLEEVQKLPLRDICNCVTVANSSSGNNRDEVDSPGNESVYYEPLRLMQTVVSQVNDVCLQLDDQSSDVSKSMAKQVQIIRPVSTYCIKNGRRKMEDRHVVLNDLNLIFGRQADLPPASYYAVFDGHMGQDAAAYSSAHLHHYLVESRDYPSDPGQAFRDAFVKTDRLLYDKHKTDKMKSGTTAVCSLLFEKEVYFAWAGDSQAVLVRDGKPVFVVDPHKPNRQDEMDRIVGLGGQVLMVGTWRVNGMLAVSRAIGDFQCRPHVSGDPELACIPLNGNEDFIILACDGLWDTISHEQAVYHVFDKLKTDPNDIAALSRHLVQEAKNSGSQDNITVLVVLLKSAEELAQQPLPPVPVPATLLPLSTSGPSMSFLEVMNGLEAEAAGAVSDTSPGMMNPFTCLGLHSEKVSVDSGSHPFLDASSNPSHMLAEQRLSPAGEPAVHSQLNPFAEPFVFGRKLPGDDTSPSNDQDPIAGDQSSLVFEDDHLAGSEVVMDDTEESEEEPWSFVRVEPSKNSPLDVDDLKSDIIPSDNSAPQSDIIDSTLFTAERLPADGMDDTTDINAIESSAADSVAQSLPEVVPKLDAIKLVQEENIDSPLMIAQERKPPADGIESPLEPLVDFSPVSDVIPNSLAQPTQDTLELLHENDSVNSIVQDMLAESSSSRKDDTTSELLQQFLSPAPASSSPMEFPSVLEIASSTDKGASSDVAELVDAVADIVLSEPASFASTLEADLMPITPHIDGGSGVEFPVVPELTPAHQLQELADITIPYEPAQQSLFDAVSCTADLLDVTSPAPTQPAALEELATECSVPITEQPQGEGHIKDTTSVEEQPMPLPAEENQKSMNTTEELVKIVDVAASPVETKVTPKPKTSSTKATTKPTTSKQSVVPPTKATTASKPLVKRTTTTSPASAKAKPSLSTSTVTTKPKTASPAVRVPKDPVSTVSKATKTVSAPKVPPVASRPSRPTGAATKAIGNGTTARRPLVADVKQAKEETNKELLSKTQSRAPATRPVSTTTRKVVPGSTSATARSTTVTKTTTLTKTQTTTKVSTGSATKPAARSTLPAKPAATTKPRTSLVSSKTTTTTTVTRPSSAPVVKAKVPAKVGVKKTVSEKEKKVTNGDAEHVVEKDIAPKEVVSAQ